MGDNKKELIQQKYWQLWEQAQSDPEYARLFQEMAELEPLYEAVLEGLCEEDEDIIRDYVSQCEDMNRRLLECACEALFLSK